MKTKIEFPFLRNELISHIEILSDIEAQRSLWVNFTRYKTKTYSEFDAVIDFLYRDYNLADDPYDFIGEMLVDHTEADLLKELDKKLDVIFERYGGKLSDEEYMSKPEWQAVIAAAKKLLDKLNATPVEEV